MKKISYSFIKFIFVLVAGMFISAFSMGAYSVQAAESADTVMIESENVAADDGGEVSDASGSGMIILLGGMLLIIIAVVIAVVASVSSVAAASDEI